MKGNNLNQNKVKDGSCFQDKPALSRHAHTWLSVALSSLKHSASSRHTSPQPRCCVPQEGRQVLWLQGKTTANVSRSCRKALEEHRPGLNPSSAAY